MRIGRVPLAIGFGTPVFNVSGQFSSVLPSGVERLHWRPKATASATDYRHSGMAVQCHQCHLTGMTEFELHRASWCLEGLRCGLAHSP